MSKKFDPSHRHYYYAVIIGWGFSILACITDISFSAVSYALGRKSWLDIISAAMLAPFYITMVLSGFTYISRIVQSTEQALHAQTTLKNSLLNPQEKAEINAEKNLAWVNGIWTLCGALFGVLVSIAICVDPLNKVYKQDHFNYVAYFLCLVTGVSWGSGLANRMIGKSRPFWEKWGMRTGALLGLGVAIALYYSMDLSSLVVSGFVGIFTCNLGFMPMAAIFFPSFVGLMGSITDYAIKIGEFFVCHYWRSHNIHSESPLYQRIVGCADRQTDRHEEYWGTVIGAVIGVAIGSSLLVVLVMKPYLLGFTASLEVPAGILFVLTALAGGAAAGSRTGNAIAFYEQRKVAAEKADIKQEATPPLQKQPHPMAPILENLVTSNHVETPKTPEHPSIAPETPPSLVAESRGETPEESPQTQGLPHGIDMDCFTTLAMTSPDLCNNTLANAST